ncbi:hypothetical protein F5141DRAFT_1140144 [Pisolithus sp. B1]|nr:hypothetical protein F5141DRAFT_1140144 [Pisolithus sp. B1]
MSTKKHKDTEASIFLSLQFLVGATAINGRWTGCQMRPTTGSYCPIKSSVVRTIKAARQGLRVHLLLFGWKVSEISSMCNGTMSNFLPHCTCHCACYVCLSMNTFLMPPLVVSP